MGWLLEDKISRYRMAIPVVSHLCKRRFDGVPQTRMMVFRHPGWARRFPLEGGLSWVWPM